MFSSSETTVTTRSSMKRPSSSSSQGQACETKRKCTLGTLDPVAQKEVSVYDFLRNNGRKVHMVKGDGNIELLYIREQHYDATICAKTGKVYSSLPQLTGKQNNETIDLSE